MLQRFTRDNLEGGSQKECLMPMYTKFITRPSGKSYADIKTIKALIEKYMQRYKGKDISRL